MPTETGIWRKNEIENQHVFSYGLARWIGDFLPKDQPVIDMGCGLGTYLDYFKMAGLQDLTGIEGDDLGEYFEFDTIVVQDLAEPFDLGRKYNVLSLEVAEHIPAMCEKEYLDNITKHVDKYLILSWGIPGQAGFGHVNCKHNIEVIEELKNRGFKFLYDETMSARGAIEHYCSWFKNTILIFENA
jgi:tryptophanyl-tRNA synthetase